MITTPTCLMRGTISLWVRQYETLLLDAAADSDKSVDDLALMRPAEMSSLVSRFDTVAPLTPASIVGVFEDQAARRPDGIAVQFGEDRLCYRELNERANQLARVLQRRGVKPSSLVATSFERSLDMIVAMLAVLKAGGADVPLDSSYPLERLTMLVEDAAPSVILTQEKLAGGLPKCAATVICIDSEWPAIGREERGNLPAALAQPDGLAYVIYTSGSTGKPKGVLVTHHNVARLFAATEAWFGFDETTSGRLFHSYAFDFSVWEIWGALLYGGRLVVVPYGQRSPRGFLRLAGAGAGHGANQTPSAFHQLMHAEEAAAADQASWRCAT